MSGHQTSNNDPEYVTVGNALLAVHDPLFLEGYTRGFRDYCRYDAHSPLSDASLCALLAKRQHNKTHSRLWNAGYVLGWITALHGLPRLRHLCSCRRYQQQRQNSTQEVTTSRHTG